MANNTTLNPGALGDVIATKDVAGVKHELVINEFSNGSGGATEVSAASPMPVTDSNLEVSAASIDLKINDGSQKTQVVDGSGNVIGATSNALDVNIKSGNVTLVAQDIQIGAVELKNAGTDDRVAVINSAPTTEFGVVTRNIPSGTQPVSGTFYQATQPVSAAALPLPAGAATETTLAAIKTKTDNLPAQGQALAAASLPVVLTAAQIATLTPPAAITGFSTETTLASIKDTAGIKKITDPLPAGTNVIGHIIADSGSTTVVTGNVTVIQGTASNLKVAATLDAETTKVIGTVNVAASQTITAAQATAANLNMTEASAANILTKLTAGAASMIKLEDVASADADAGVPMLAVRKATPANTSGTDGDYEFLQMSAGKLWVQAGATQKPFYGATVVLAVTALQSMASSATVGWKSVRTSNLSTLANDFEVFVSITTANTAPANDKAVYLYVIPWYTTDAGSTWFASSGGTATLPSSADATYTIASPHNFRLLGVLNYTTQQMVMQDTFLLSNCFGNRLPDGFSFCVINFSGAALSTGCILDITPVNDILV